MLDVEAIATALADNLSEVLGTQVSPYLLASPASVSAHVYPSAVEYDLAGSRGLDRYTFTLQVTIGLLSDIGSQKTLYKYLSAERSVKEHIEADAQLGGLVSDLRVVRCNGFQLITVEARGPYMAAEWIIDLLVPGR